ncbi:MAG: ABC transporter permease [Candidatus Acidiferrales bacterium]
MRWIDRLKLRVRSLFRRGDADAELSEELQFHLQREIEANVAAGMTPVEARRAALVEFGGLARLTEECRDARRVNWIQDLGQDIGYGLRMLRKNPGFTAVAILTLALGIGANTAIFSVLDAVILRPLPYPAADRLVLIWTDLNSAGTSDAPFSGPDMADVRARSHLLADVGGIWVGRAALTGTGEPEQVKLGFVTDNFLTIVGVHPAMGRLFVAQDNVQGAAPVVILSDGLWRRRFGASVEIVGQTVRLDGSPATVIGVMPENFRLMFPAGFHVPPDVQVWTPFRRDVAHDPRDLNFLRVLGRLRPDATIAATREEMHAIAGQLRKEYVVDSKQGEDFGVAPLQKVTTREIRPALLALFCGVGLVLLIACANVANLLLSRAGLRRREVALRSALGATRGRLFRQLLTESLLLSFFGGALGMLLGWWWTAGLLALRPKSLVLVESAGLNFTVLGYALAITLAAGVLFGLAPAAEASRINLIETLKSAGHGAGSGRGRLRSLLVASEVALGFVLLFGSGLLIRTFLRIVGVNPGFNSGHVLTFQVAPGWTRYPSDATHAQYFEQLRKNVAALPGVGAVGGSSHLPFDDYPNWYSYYWPEGAAIEKQQSVMADHRATTPGYFAAMGIAMIAGRDFTDADDASRQRVAVVDDLLAERAWPGESALGKKLYVETIKDGNFTPGAAQVIGVVKHVRAARLADEGRAAVYVAYAQNAREQVAFAVRTEEEPTSLVGAIRAEMDRMDKDVPMSKVRVMDDYLRDARAATRFTTLLAGMLAGLALVLAAIGIYGVTAYSVGQRRSEIGIRMALGAQRGDILRMILGEGMVWVFGGMAVGVGLSVILIPGLSSLLFGVPATDAVTFGGVALFLGVVGLVACYVPARRALRADPIVVLRYE